MLAKQRIEKILSILSESGAVTVTDLALLFSVSPETVRRDLITMEKEGLLMRVHGGAVSKGRMRGYADLSSRNQENVSEKEFLTKEAVHWVSEGDVIAVDSGSTAILFAEALKEEFETLTVVTHSLDVFRVLSERKGFSLILCGGHFLAEENAFYGTFALNMLSEISVKKTFLFPSSVSMRYGICDFQENLVHVQKKLIASADEVFILADSSKFEKKSLMKISEMNRNFHYVTDQGLSSAYVALYRENGYQIHI